MNTGLTFELVCRYPYAKVQTSNYTCQIVGLSKETNELVLRATGGIITDAFIHPISDCRLILKPLKDISDEDAIEVAKIDGAIGKDLLLKEIGRNMANFIKNMDAPYQSKVFDFLRTKNYCTEDKADW